MVLRVAVMSPSHPIALTPRASMMETRRLTKPKSRSERGRRGERRKGISWSSNRPSTKWWWTLLHQQCSTWLPKESNSPLFSPHNNFRFSKAVPTTCLTDLWKGATNTTKWEKNTFKSSKISSTSNLWRTKSWQSRLSLPCKETIRISVTGASQAPLKNTTCRAFNLSTAIKSNSPRDPLWCLFPKRRRR